MEWQGPVRIVGIAIVFAIVWLPIVYGIVSVWNWVNPNL